ncbi:MAG TPA: nucleotidyl transferase AbiEii/AbiGii toxin family protein [Anaeromyxobacteraceae bacterium]|nr:nucleotidyl transferase AbiEii/AbiGii toxin family protein [Anaeromyxobacteraceae bacterium]
MFAELLERVAKALDAAGIAYMVVGGQAVLLHGEARLTKDVDVTLAAGLERLADVLAVAKAAGLGPLVDPESFTRRTLVLPCQDERTKLRVDFILSFSPYERQAIDRARLVTMGSAAVRFATAEDLVIHKMIAGRPRDVEDVKGVLRKNPGLDRAYVSEWLKRFEDVVERPLASEFAAIAGAG